MAGEERLLPPEDEAHLLATSAWVVEDALVGRFTGRYPFGPEEAKLRRRRNLVQRMRQVYAGSGLLLILLIFIELPSWCTPGPPDDSWQVECWVAAPGGERPLNETFGVPFLRPEFGFLLEAVGIALASLAMLCELRLEVDLGRSRLYDLSDECPDCEWRSCFHTPAGLSAALLLAMWADLVLKHGAGIRTGVSWYGRVPLLFYWPQVRNVFASARRAMRNFLNVVVVWLLAVVFFAWLLMLVLRSPGVKPDVPPELLSGSLNGFPSLLNIMFCMATGATVPDGMDELVRRFHWIVFLFYPFIFLTVLLFTPMMLAVVYSAYQVGARVSLKEFYTQRNRGLATVFRMLAMESKDGVLCITFDVFDNFLRHLRKLPHFSRLRQENSLMLFQSLDDDADGTLSPEEFMDACDSLLQHMWVTHDKSVFIREYGFELTKLRAFVESGALETIMSGVLFLNLVFVVSESMLFDDGDLPPAIEALESIFSTVYVLDLLARLAVDDFGKYWSNWSNRFDFVVSWGLFLSGIVTQTSSFSHLRPVMTYINILRVLRVARLIRRVPRFDVLVAQLANLWIVAGDMFLMLAITMLFFSMLGHSLFGGELTKGNSELVGISLPEGYELWNFNGMLSSFFTVFNMLVNSYVPGYAAALDSVSTVPFVGTVYCALLFFVGVNVGFNIVTAFLLDVFLSLREVGAEVQEAANLERVRSRLRDEGKVLHVRSPQGLKRLRALAGVIDGLEEAILEARQAILESRPAAASETGRVSGRRGASPAAASGAV